MKIITFLQYTPMHARRIQEEIECVTKNCDSQINLKALLRDVEKKKDRDGTVFTFLEHFIHLEIVVKEIDKIF